MPERDRVRNGCNYEITVESNDSLKMVSRFEAKCEAYEEKKKKKTFQIKEKRFLLKI